MGGFFNIDGPFYKFGSILADIMILSILWIVFSIPLVTVGASTTAVYYVATKRVSNAEGYLLRDFWKSFKHNFITSTMVTVSVAIAIGIVLLNIKNISVFGGMWIVVYPLQLCILFEIVITTIYIFPVLSRFDVRFFQLFRTAFFMANRHLLTTIICVITFAMVFVLTYRYGIAMILAMGVYSFATSFFLLRVFKKYRPEIIPGELEKELRPLNIEEDMPGEEEKKD